MQNKKPYSERQEELIRENKERLAQRTEKSDLEILADEIRSKQSPDQVEQNILDAYTMLKDTITGLMSENAQVRRDSFKQGMSNMNAIKMMGHELGEQSNELVSRYEEILEQERQKSGVLVRIANDIKEGIVGKIPTLKGFMDGIMSNSNPLISLGVNMVKDAKDYIKEMSEGGKEEKQEEAKRRKLLQQEQSEIDSKLSATAEDLKEVVEEQKEEIKKARRTDSPLVSRTEALRLETVRQTAILNELYKVWAGEDYKDPTTIEDENNLQLLESIDKKMGDSLEIAQDTEKHFDKLISLEEANKLQDQKQSLVDKGKKASKISATDLLPKDGKSGGGLGKLLGGLAMILSPAKIAMMLGGAGLLGGIVGGLATFFGGITKIGGPIIRILPKLAKGAGIIGLVITLVQGIFDFMDGWENAGEILGKADVDLMDKISAGLASFLGAFVGIVDDILGLFGVDSNMKEGFVKKTAEFFSALMHPMDSIRDMLESFENTDFYKGVKESIEFIMGLPQRMFDGMLSYLKSAIKYIPDMFLPQSLIDWANSDGLTTSMASNNEVKASDSTMPSTSREVTPQIVQLTREQEALAELDKQTAAYVQQSVRNDNSVKQTTTNNFNGGLNTRNNDGYLFGK